MLWPISNATSRARLYCSTVSWEPAKISGSFPSHDPQAVLNSLQGVLGFEQNTVFGRLIVLR
jgi:ferric-dicitrate binding protein FerR (iron transport regulator)